MQQFFSQENTETEWLEYGWPENKLTIISAEPELGYLVTMNIRNSGGITFKGYAYGNGRGGMFLENAFGPNKERVSFDIDVTDRGLLCTLTEDSHSSYIDREPREYVLIEDDDDRLKLYPHYFTYPDAKDAWSPPEELVGVWENVEGGDAPLKFTYQMEEVYPESFFPVYYYEYSNIAFGYVSTPTDNYCEHILYNEDNEVFAWLWFEREISSDLLLHIDGNHWQKRKIFKKK